jgi:hypothetical protein
METRALGKTGLRVSCLGFDIAPLENAEFKEAQDVLNTAHEAGVTLYSTGRGDPDSEIKLGYGLNLRHHDVVVVAKTREREGRKVARAIERSISHLHTDYIDVYEMSSLIEDADLELAQRDTGALAAMRKAQQAGKIRFVSASSLRREILERLISTEQVDVVEFPVNNFDLDFVDRVIPLARQRGLGVLGVYPFAGGAFGDPTMALRFALDQDITAVMAGMHTRDHVRQNSAVAAHFIPLTDNEREHLFEVAKHLGRDFCRFCGECLPCPKEIDIPRVLELLRASWRFHLRDWAAGTYASLSVQASVCDACGVCEERCSYNVNIISLLERAGHHFQHT